MTSNSATIEFGRYQMPRRQPEMPKSGSSAGRKRRIAGSIPGLTSSRNRPRGVIAPLLRALHAHGASVQHVGAVPLGTTG
jgi:hypothetical protein